MESHHVTALKQGGTPVSPAMSAENVYSWGQWVGHQISNPCHRLGCFRNCIYSREDIDFSPLKIFGLSGGGDGTLNINAGAGRLVHAFNPATKENESRGSQVQA